MSMPPTGRTFRTPVVPGVSAGAACALLHNLGHIASWIYELALCWPARHCSRTWSRQRRRWPRLPPTTPRGLDWLSGFSQTAIEEVRLTLTDQTEARALFREEQEKILAAPPAQLAMDFQAVLPGTDLALLTKEAISVQQALAPGIEGSWDDCVAQLTPWGSMWPRYRSRCCCCTAARTGPCHSAMVNGWPRTSPASKPGSSTTKGTPSGKITSKTTRLAHRSQLLTFCPSPGGTGSHRGRFNRAVRGSLRRRACRGFRAAGGRSAGPGPARRDHRAARSWCRRRG